MASIIHPYEYTEMARPKCKNLANVSNSVSPSRMSTNSYRMKSEDDMQQIDVDDTSFEIGHNQHYKMPSKSILNQTEDALDSDDNGIQSSETKELAQEQDRYTTSRRFSRSPVTDSELDSPINLKTNTRGQVSQSLKQYESSNQPKKVSNPSINTNLGLQDEPLDYSAKSTKPAVSNRDGSFCGVTRPYSSKIIPEKNAANLERHINSLKRTRVAEHDEVTSGKITQKPPQHGYSYDAGSSNSGMWENRNGYSSVQPFTNERHHFHNDKHQLQVAEEDFSDEHDSPTAVNGHSYRTSYQEPTQIESMHHHRGLKLRHKWIAERSNSEELSYRISAASKHNHYRSSDAINTTNFVNPNQIGLGISPYGLLQANAGTFHEGNINTTQIFGDSSHPALAHLADNPTAARLTNMADMAKGAFKNYNVNHPQPAASNFPHPIYPNNDQLNGYFGMPLSQIPYRNDSEMQNTRISSGEHFLELKNQSRPSKSDRNYHHRADRHKQNAFQSAAAVPLLMTTSATYSRKSPPVTNGFESSRSSSASPPSRSPSMANSAPPPDSHQTKVETPNRAGSAPACTLSDGGSPLRDSAATVQDVTKADDEAQHPHRRNSFELYYNEDDSNTRSPPPLLNGDGAPCGGGGSLTNASSHSRHSSSSNDELTASSRGADGGSRKKRSGRSLPDELKDKAYWERRRKNNEAAKRSRDARRAKEDEIAVRAALLEQENLTLRVEMASLKSETAKLRCLLYNS